MNRYNIVKFKDVIFTDGNNFIDEYNYISIKSRYISRYINRKVFCIRLIFKPR